MEELRKKQRFYKTEKGIGLLKTAASQTALFVLNFLSGGISFAGGLSPFATGFCAGTENTYLLSSCIGASTGYLFFFGFFDSLRFVAAILMICLIKLGVNEKATGKRQLLFVTLTAFLTTFFSSAAVFLAIGGEFSYIIMCLCESVISACFSAFTLKLTNIRALKKKGAFFAPTDTIAVIFSGCVILLALDNFSIGSFSPARTAAYFIIMLFALCGKESASSIASLCCGLTLGFNERHPHLMAGYIITGLFTGLSGTYGKFPVAVSMIISSTLALILKGDSETAIAAVSEAVLAGAAFVFIPEKYLFALAQKVIPLSRDAYDEEKGRMLLFDLKRSAKALKDISESVLAVSSLLQKTEKKASVSFTGFVCEDVCKECTKYDFCWTKCAGITEKTFERAQKTLIEKGRLIQDDLPDRLSLICRLPEKITDSFNQAYCEHNARLVARKDIYEAKKAAAQQFYSLGKILDDAALSFSRIPKSDPVRAAAVAPVFRDMGFELSGISAFSSVDGASTIQVYCSHVPVMTDISLLIERLFEATGTVYLEPVADEYSDEGTVLSFTQEKRFTAEYHIRSHTGAGEELCGDTCECFFDGTGYFYAVLSDGMGSGSRACLDSVMTGSLMSRLLRAGFSPETSFEAVNCALLIKSAEETLSTLDILKIDLESGEASFFKAGAAASVIKKGDKTLAVEKSSLPLGILRETDFETSSTALCNGDMVFLMSDGASVIPHATFKEILRENKNAGVITLSDIILKKALEFSESGKHDDITVACIKLVET